MIAPRDIGHFQLYLNNAAVIYAVIYRLCIDDFETSILFMNCVINNLKLNI